MQLRGNVMKLVGFTKNKNGIYKEYLPYNKQFSSDIDKRAIFFNMFTIVSSAVLNFLKSKRNIQL